MKEFIINLRDYFLIYDQIIVDVEVSASRAQNINILWTYPFAVNCLSEEKFPVSETLKIIEGLNLYKTHKWWCAVVLMDSFGKKQIGVYLWNKKSDQWKRRQKFVIHNKDEWGRIKEKVEKLIPNLP